MDEDVVQTNEDLLWVIGVQLNRYQQTQTMIMFEASFRLRHRQEGIKCVDTSQCTLNCSNVVSAALVASFVKLHIETMNSMYQMHNSLYCN